MNQATSLGADIAIILDESTAVMQLNLDNSLASRALRGAVREMNPNANIQNLNNGKKLIILGYPGPVVEHKTVEIIEGYGVPMAIVYHNGAREKASHLIDRFLKYWGRMPTWAYDN